MFKKIVLTLSFICLINITPATSQVTIRGIIKDAKTGKVLPVANIQIKGTYKGTITNDDGIFTLKIDRFPSTIVIRYIGYEKKEITITKESPTRLEIQLNPVVIEMPEIVVDSEDPAVKIMRKVIQKKQEWWDKLQSYKADAYCRTTFTNDSGIVLISETVSEAYWDKDKGSLDIIKAKRQTADTDNMFLGTVSHFPNFYNDNVLIKRFDMINVIHPHALKFYHFKLIGERSIEDKIVYEISVTPKTKLQPVFEGKISVLDEEFALLAVELQPAEHIILPAPIEKARYCYKQQFSNFNKEFWLPVSLVREADVKVGFPGLRISTKFKDMYEVKNYEVNISLPDSLYAAKGKEIVRLDSISINNDLYFEENKDITVPLSSDEAKALETIDSTFTIMEAFNATGILAKLIAKAEDDEDKEKSKKLAGKKSKISYKPEIWFNRADGFHLAVNNSIGCGKDCKIDLLMGYKTALKRLTYGVKYKYKFLGLEYFNRSELRYHSEIYPRLITSLVTLSGNADYYDYYWIKRIRGEIDYQLNKIQTGVTIGINTEKHSSLKKETDYNIFGRDYIHRENPGIQNGNLQSVDLKIQYGSKFIPFGVIGQKRAVFFMEHGSSKILASDFSFTRYEFILDWRINTFLKRRLMPNCIDLRLVAGTSTGDLPFQKFGCVDASLGFLKSFGAFKSLNSRPYEGEKYLAVFWEHNFRTVPFEILGMNILARKSVEIILHGASGRTWIAQKRLKNLGYTPRYTDNFHHEIGLSLNKLFYIFRFDFTQRLDKKEFYFSMSVPRLY